MLTIGEVARRAGLRPSTLRYYERAGLLPAPRRVGGQRRYDTSVLARLATIRLAQGAGFSLAEIRMLLADFAPEAPPAPIWRTLATRKLGEVALLMAQLATFQDRLQAVLRCECPSFAACPLRDAMP